MEEYESQKDLKSTEKAVDPVALTRTLVQLDSTNPGSSERAVAEYILKLAGQYLPENAVVSRKEVQPGRPILMLELPAGAPGNAAGLGAEGISGRAAVGAAARELVFICHMDTVPLGEGWKEQPLGGELRQGRIYGRGSCDMKSGLAASLAAFLNAAAERRRQEDTGTSGRALKWIGTMDEEADMLGASAVIQEGWVRKESLVMDCEPTDGEVQTAHKSRYWFRFTIHGKAAHASKPQEGADAISGMAYAITSVRRRVAALRKDAFLGASTITFGEIRGGIHPYQVPGECTVSVDMRVVPPYSIEEMKRLLEKGAEEAASMIPGLHCSIEITGERPPVPHNPDSELLLRLQEAIQSIEGKEAPVTAFPGYTDTAVIAGQLGCATTLSYGPGSLNQAHKPDEYVEVRDIERCYEVYSSLIRGWLD